MAESDSSFVEGRSSELTSYRPSASNLSTLTSSSTHKINAKVERNHSTTSIVSSVVDKLIQAPCIQRFFSPVGADNSPQVVYYVMWDWASKVTVISFNASNPLLVTHFGNVAFGDNKGKILWTYLAAATFIVTAVCFLTFTAIFEFEDMRCKVMFYGGLLSSACLVLFVLYFESDAVYIACTLAFVARVAFNFSNLAFDALLNCVSIGKDPHQISSRSFITGYIGMIAFGAVLLSVLVVMIFATSYDQSYILYGIAPDVCVGLWYFLFGLLVMYKFPWEVGIGPPFPDEVIRSRAHSKAIASPVDSGASTPRLMSKISVTSFARESLTASHNPMAPPASIADARHDGEYTPHGQLNSEFLESRVSWTGARTHVNAKPISVNSMAATSAIVLPEKYQEHKNEFGCCHWLLWLINQLIDTFRMLLYGFRQGSLAQLRNIRELSQFPDLALFILAFVFVEGAQSTGISVAAIILVDLFDVSHAIDIICGACGLFFSIVGLFLYRHAQSKNWIFPKTILLINLVIFVLIVVALLAVKSSNASYFFIGFSIIGGSQIGSVGAFARSIVAQLCPTDRQSRMFSLFQFCQVATSWIGPIIIASVNAASSGNNEEFLHLTILVVGGQLLISIPLLYCVNIARGSALRLERDSENLRL